MPETLRSHTVGLRDAGSRSRDRERTQVMIHPRGLLAHVFMADTGLRIVAPFWLNLFTPCSAWSPSWVTVTMSSFPSDSGHLDLDFPVPVFCLRKVKDTEAPRASTVLHCPLLPSADRNWKWWLLFQALSQGRYHSEKNEVRNTKFWGWTP